MLPPQVLTICAAHRPARCHQCPLRTPCLKFGAAPTRTVKELDRSRKVFAAEAMTVLAAMAEGGAE